MTVFVITTVVVVAIGRIVLLFKNTGHRNQGHLRDAASEVLDPTGEAPSTAPAGNIQPGIRAFMKGRYNEAFKLLEPAAKEGNLRAQQCLAKMYYAGNGVAKDREKYLYWMSRAAENGDRPSRFKVKKIKRASG